MDDLFMSISISDQQFQMRIMLIIDIKNKTNKTLLIAFIVFRFSMMQYLRYYIYLHNFNKRHHNLPITYFITKNKFLFWSRLTRDLENQPRSQKYGSLNNVQWTCEQWRKSDLFDRRAISVAMLVQSEIQWEYVLQDRGHEVNENWWTWHILSASQHEYSVIALLELAKDLGFDKSLSAGGEMDFPEYAGYGPAARVGGVTQ